MNENHDERGRFASGDSGGSGKVIRGTKFVNPATTIQVAKGSEEAYAKFQAAKAAYEKHKAEEKQAKKDLKRLKSQLLGQ